MACLKLVTVNRVTLLNKLFHSVELEEHFTTGFNHISLTGNKRLECLHKIREKKVLPVGKP